MLRTLRVTCALSVGMALAVNAQESKDVKDQLQRCDKPIGTLAVVEPQNQYLTSLSRFNLGSPSGLIRMMASQSNCFVVVERGAAMNNIQQERALGRSGELQSDANMGGGQMKAADYVLTPAVMISNPNGGGIGGLLGGAGGAILAGVKFKKAETSMLLSDARTTVQVAAATGEAKKTDFGLGAIGWGGGAVVGGGGYTNTAEGKVIAASYLDNYNKIVTDIKNNPELMARADKFKATGLSGGDTKSGAVFAEGDVLAPKIDNIALFADAKDDAKEVLRLKKTDELVYLGTETNGFLKVQGSNGTGWVKKSLIVKH